MLDLPHCSCDGTSAEELQHDLRFQVVLAEHPRALWVSTTDHRARHIEFSRALYDIAESDLPWSSWRAVQIDSTGRLLLWPNGLTYRLEDLIQDEQSSSRYSLIRVTHLASAEALYRPLLHAVPVHHLSTSLEAEVLRCCGLNPEQLAQMNQYYAAPAPLFQRRLLDLVLALGKGYGMNECHVRDLLHWHWQSATRRTALQWPTPLAAIAVGNLAQVEATLYPHLSSPPWQ